MRNKVIKREITILLLILQMVFICVQSSLMVTKDMPIKGMMDMENLDHAGKQHLKMHGKRETKTLPSVVLIPGLGGSQLKAKLNNSDPGHWFCYRNSDEFLIWLQLTQLIPIEEKCWQERIQIKYDGSTIHNSSGVEIFPFSWGSPITFEYVDPDFKRETVYFAPIVESLLALGYVRNVNLFGAPYDWRLSPNYAQDYFRNTKELIERAYSVNNLPVVIVAHSMGNMYIKYMMEGVSQQWKDKHIKGMASIAPPWVGAIASVDTILSGSDFSIPYLAPLAARVVQRSFPASYFVLPNQKYYGKQVLVSTPSRNYTSLDYSSLFSDIDFPEGMEMWNEVQKANYDPYISPGINIKVYYGEDVPTHEGVIYSSDDFDSKSEIKLGNGDGTVPLASLTFGGDFWDNNNSTHWYKQQGYTGQTHVGILAYQPLIYDILLQFI